MAEYTVAPLAETATTGNLTDFVVDNAVRTPHLAVFSRQEEDQWRDVTARDFLTEVTGVAKGLVTAGVSPGDRIGLMSKTRYEWTLSDFAIWFAGAVTVPIYETSSTEQVQWILRDSGAVGVIVETAAHESALAEVQGELPGLEHVWQIDGGALESLTAAGRDRPDAEIEERRATMTPDSLATIIYTSGTMGRPKGCELTHGNFMVDVDNVVEELAAMVKAENSSTLLFLPLAHVFARFIQLVCVRATVRLGHSADVKNLVADLATFRPTFVLAVPRVFEKIYNSSQQKAEAAGKGKIFAAAATTAIAYSEAIDNGGPGLSLRLKHAIFDKLVYSKLRAALGGNVRYAVSGGAPLGARLGHFFRGIGVLIVEGYGLTETTAPATVSAPERLRIGTVGRPIPGSSIRIAEDGEVLIKGGHVFRGYWGDEAATRECMTDGWFHSGDLGELDADGYLRITGRKKEIIVTAGGKNVAPTVLEDRLRAHPLISQCMVVGDGQPFIAGLITLDAEALPGWLEAKGLPARPLAEASTDPQVLAEVQSAVDEANKAVSKPEAIKKFSILTVDFTEAGGQLTPKLSLKRSVVMKEFATEVDALYS